MILDTSALVAILFGEQEAAAFIHLIRRAERRLLSVANFLELSMVIETQIGPAAGRQCDAFLQRAEIVVEPITVAHGQLARQAFLDFGKGRHPAGLNFGDCFAYALAKAMNEPLLFKGNDFTKTDVRAVSLTC